MFVLLCFRHLPVALTNIANVAMFALCCFASQTWLKNYGYLLPHAVPLDLRQQKVMLAAVASMQRFYGLPVTGRLDELTVG